MITPHVQISLDAVSHNARVIQQAVADGGKRWAPWLSRCVPTEILSDIILPMTDHASCGRIEDAEVLVECGFRHLLLTRPVVDPEALSGLSILLHRAEFSVTIDHFRQAELLSHAATQAGRTIGVMIDVDLGRQTTGVRPGPDASRLAVAASTLPGIRVAGVFADDRGTAMRAHAEQLQAFEDMITVAQHCRRTMANDGVHCEETATGRHCDFAVSCQHEKVTVVLCDPFGNTWSDEIIGHESDNRLSPAVSIISRVISRPAFEWCVINAGTQIFGSSGNVAVLQPRGAHILTAVKDVATLSLSDFALDLRIGDTVQLAARHPHELFGSTGAQIRVV